MMKKLINPITGALPLILLCGSLFGSCIAEDLSDCPNQQLQISFTFDDSAESVPTRSGGPHSVTLYAYGDNGQCAMMHDLEIESLNATATIDVSLTPGTYDFVAWVNHSNEYFELPHYEQFPSVRPTKDVSVLYLTIPATSTIDYTLPRLLHGSASDQSVQNGAGRVDIPLVQNTNYIHFTVEGLDRTTSVYEFRVFDNNGAYSFDNEFAACTPFTYVSTARFADGGTTLDADMTLLRLAEGRTPEFILRDRDTGKTIYPSQSDQETNLVKLIQKAYESQGKSIDFDRQHVFDIKIKFSGGVDMDVTITVNGWEIIEDDSGLRP